jgi:regulator of protease activity HflC (stomatin/prohibitin superfamily)
MDKTPFQLESFVIGNVQYPKAISDAVENKLKAEQLLLEKETQKLIAIKDAEIELAKAIGIKKAQLEINRSLTPNYLQYKAIEAQEKMALSPNNTTIYIPVGRNGIPIVHNR